MCVCVCVCVLDWCPLIVVVHKVGAHTCSLTLLSMQGGKTARTTKATTRWISPSVRNQQKVRPIPNPVKLIQEAIAGQCNAMQLAPNNVLVLVAVQESCGYATGRTSCAQSEALSGFLFLYLEVFFLRFVAMRALFLSSGVFLVAIQSWQSSGELLAEQSLNLYREQHHRDGS